jgi:SPP1 family predicted phage head-tail adaptor
MSAGARRQYVVIKQKTVTGQDSRGQDIYTWTTVATAWASINAISGREFAAVQQRWAEARFRFRIEPFIGNIGREMVIVWGSRMLNILDVEDPDGRRKAVEGYAAELVA